MSDTPAGWRWVLRAAACCIAAAGCGAAPVSPPAGPPAGEAACTAGRLQGRLVRGRSTLLLDRELAAGQRLTVQLEATPPQAVTLSLEGPLDPAGAAAATVVDFPSADVWTGFPRPLPPGLTRCPADGCPPEGGSAWEAPGIDRAVALAGRYRVRLQAAEGDVVWSACLRVGPTPAGP